MKSIRNVPRAAFTLIELLVVISIIALLASMAVPAANMVMKKAKETQAKAMMAGIIMGIKTYQSEYNRLPDPALNQGSGGSPTTEDKDMPQDGNASNDLMPILRPDPNSTPPYANPRRINFYDPPIAKSGANGLDDRGRLMDPWGRSGSDGHEIHVLLDYDGDGQMDDPTGGGTKLQTSIAAYSTGSPVSPPDENKDPNKFLCSWK